MRRPLRRTMEPPSGSSQRTPQGYEPPLLGLSEPTVRCANSCYLQGCRETGRRAGGSLRRWHPGEDKPAVLTRGFSEAAIRPRR
jgi:hypothetical protein